MLRLVCPKCQSRSLRREGDDRDAGVFLLHVSCPYCGTGFTAVYTLTELIDVTPACEGAVVVEVE